jgi:hypothetical protein
MFHFSSLNFFYLSFTFAISTSNSRYFIIVFYFLPFYIISITIFLSLSIFFSLLLYPSLPSLILSIFGCPVWNEDTEKAKMWNFYYFHAWLIGHMFNIEKKKKNEGVWELFTK